jgi:hypothetical protein
MKFWFKISIFIFALYLGNPLRDYLNQKIQQNSFGSNFFKIDKALKASTDISLWGNSTSFMSFDAETIQTELNVSCYNYGLEGIYFNELFHLEAFNNRCKNKQIIWVINPFEFLNDEKSKIKPIELFLPFSKEKQFNNIINHHQFKTLKYFGWNTIFRYNAEHWKFILNGESKVPFNEFGNVKFNKKFEKRNEFYNGEKMSFSPNKINILNNLIQKIKVRNKLIVIIPPNLSKKDFTPFIQQIDCDKIINYANFFTSPSNFQDHIHINPNEMKILSHKFCDDYKLISD